MRELDREVGLRDGTRVRIRPIRPEDAPLLIDLYDRLSLDSRYHRFFSLMRRLPPDWAKFLATVDYRGRFALVVERPGVGAPALIAVARYETTSDPALAEVAFVVEDDWQGRGLGTILLQDVLRAAEANGIAAFQAWVLADNRRMLDMFARFTDVIERRLEQSVVSLRFRRAPPDASARRR